MSNLSTLETIVADVGDNFGDCRRKRRLSPFSATIRRQSPFSVTVAEIGVAIYAEIGDHSLQCGQGYTLVCIR